MDVVHRRVRHVAAAGSALVAVVYLLIGFGVITVVDDQGSGVVPPMVISGVLFALLAGLVALSARRALWVAGAALQILVIVGYLVISAERVPMFEAWGIGLKALQAGLLAGFVYLALQRSPRTSTRAGV